MTLFNTYLMDINVSNIVFNAYSDVNVTKNIAHASLLENYYLEGNTTTSLMLNLTIVLTETTARLAEILINGFKLVLYTIYEYNLRIDSLEVPVTTFEVWEISIF